MIITITIIMLIIIIIIIINVPIYVRISGNQFKCNYQKARNYLWNFHYVSEIYIKFLFFLRKDEAYSLSICEIIDSEKHCYLNVKKFLFQDKDDFTLDGM